MKMKNALLAGSFLLFTGLVHADPALDTQGVIPRSSAEAPNNAVGVSLAPGLRGTASVGLESSYNSNYYLQADNPQSSFGFVLTPNVLLLREAKNIRYQFGAGLEAAKYTNVDQGPDSYLDSTISGKLEWNPLTRHRFAGDYYTKFSHDPFGSFRTENGFNVGQPLDKWVETAGHVSYRYGAQGALFNLESAVGVTARRYTTNRDSTAILDFRSISLRETGYVNVSSKTSFLAEVEHDNTGYYKDAPSFPGRDFQENHYRAGVHWLATGTTSGDIRVGRFRRSYDNPQVPKNTATDWLATLTWAPLAYSVFSVQTGVQSAQSYLADVQLIENRFELVDWTHDWSYSFRTRLLYTHVNSEFVGSSRTDNIDTVGAEANYLSSQRWMWLTGASYSHRTSDIAARDYNDTSVYMALRYSR